MTRLIHITAALLFAVPLSADDSTLNQNVNVKVCPSLPLKVTLAASPASIVPGDTSLLSWTAERPATFTLSEVGPVTGSSAMVTPAGLGDHVYTITAVDNCNNTGSAAVTVNVHKMRVFLEGSRYSSGPSVLDYMLSPGMYCYDCIGGALLGTTKSFADSHAKNGTEADFDAFANEVKGWPPDVGAAKTAHVGGETYIVDEKGNVLGSVPTLSLYDTGVPGLSYLGDPYGTGGRNRLWIGEADFSYKGADYEVVGFLSASPIILDLDGDSKPDVDRGQWLPHPGRFNGSKAVLFDITTTGFPNITEWIGPKDGLLVAPLKPGQTPQGSDLFGNPLGYVDGYQKLGMLYDKDANGFIDGKELEGFMVWQDLDSNGAVDPGELKPVQQWGITRIGTKQQNLKGTFVINGETRATWDWWPTSMLVYPKPIAKLAR